MSSVEELRANKICMETRGMSFAQAQRFIKMGLVKGNEFLNDIEGVISKQIIMDTLKTKVKFIDWYGNASMTYGELEQFRQTLLGKHGTYSDQLDVNNHYKIKTLTQYAETMYKDVYTLSMSVDIIKNAFLNVSNFNSYINQYMSRLTKTLELVGLDRFMEMFSTIPIIYKVPKDINDIDLAKAISKLIAKMSMVTTKFNMSGLPNRVAPGEGYAIMRIQDNINIQYSAVAGLYHFGDIKDGAIVKDMVQYDFKDPYTRCIITDNMAYGLDKRLDEVSRQQGASTLIEDKFTHQGTRAMRNEFASMIRVVSDDYVATKIDYRASPFTRKNAETGELIKDEPDIIDVTAGVNGDVSTPIKPPTDILTDLGYSDLGDVPTNTLADLTKALQDKNPKLDVTKVTITNITDTSATLNVDNDQYIVSSYQTTTSLTFKVVPTPPPSKKNKNKNENNTPPNEELEDMSDVNKEPVENTQSESETSTNV